MMNDTVRRLVMIPAHNEAPRIANVIATVQAAVPGWTVVVIDDGSDDATADRAVAAGARVLRLPCNQGYGVALQTGYMFAAEFGADVLVQLDADGQHDPHSIPTLVQALQEHDVDVVLGSRFLGEPSYPVPAVRRAGQRLFAAVLGWCTGKRYTDPTSGFQAIHRRALWFFTSDAFPFDYPDANVLLMLDRAGLRCREVPAVFRPSPPGKVSMHAGIKPLYYILRMFLSLGLTLLRPKPQRPATPAREDAR